MDLDRPLCIGCTAELSSVASGWFVRIFAKNDMRLVIHNLACLAPAVL